MCIRQMGEIPWLLNRFIKLSSNNGEESEGWMIDADSLECAKWLASMPIRLDSIPYLIVTRIHDEDYRLT
jgi:hypothetical protein